MFWFYLTSVIDTITKGHFEYNGGRGLLYKYNGSPGAIVMACFPLHTWLEWRFNFRAKEIQKKEIEDFLRRIEEEHHLSPDRLDDWYGLPSEIKDTTQLEFIKRHGGIYGMGGKYRRRQKTKNESYIKHLSGVLSTVYPEHNWEAKKLDHKDRRAMQSWVKSVVQKLLPNSGTPQYILSSVLLFSRYLLSSA